MQANNEWNMQSLDEDTFIDEKVSDNLDVDMRALARYLLKHLRQISIVAVAVTVIVALWVLFGASYTYRATEKLYIMGGSNAIVDLSDLQLGSSLVTDYRQVFSNVEIHEQIRQKLHHEYTNEQLDKMIELTNPSGTRILVITVSSNSEYEALRLVEEYSEAARLFIEDRMGSRIPSIFEKPSLLEPYRGLVVKSVLAFLLSALIMTVAYALIFILDDRIKNRETVERDLAIPMLGAMPLSEQEKKQKRSKKST
ncbi:MAG: hypothetical protein IJ189_05715 [Clostridia bacterium]|nr:hypothetical protein [Clostridia bacterium]